MGLFYRHWADPQNRPPTCVEKVRWWPTVTVSHTLCGSVVQCRSAVFSHSPKGIWVLSEVAWSRADDDEEAARQQGGLFLRENSSNGGKAIRTFWLHTKFG
jgi:hypothetical protein